MSKRTTVMRMLRNRLSESKLSISVSHQYEDMVNVMGGDNSKEDQHRKNMERDIEDLEFLIEALKGKTLNRMANEMIENKEAIKKYHKGELTIDQLKERGINIVAPFEIKHKKCNCPEGAQGRSVTEDFEHQICDKCQGYFG